MLRLASLFTDGAVLCRNKQIRIFGESDSKTNVIVTLLDCQGELLAEATCQSKGGRFLVSLCPQKEQVGCRLVIRTANEQVEATDIAVGEVYLASGQSNMELELRNADEGEGIIQEHNDPLLRFFSIPKFAITGPEQQKAVKAARWHKTSPGQGGENSAVAYFFASKLRKRMPGLPVGIIGCYWGGTSITCWIEEKTLRTCTEGIRYLDEYAAQCAGKSMEAFMQEDRVFWESIEKWNKTVADYQQTHPNALWKEVECVCGSAPWNPPVGPGSPFRPAGLATTMVREIVPVTLTGILYYQGEQDAETTDQYDVLMELLISSWRSLFQDRTLPFLFVQLPMWRNWNTKDNNSWAKLRIAQANARDKTPYTGMICLLDQGEYGNIHPTKKRPVGERLAELAGNMLYGKGECSPRATGKQTERNTLIIKLSTKVIIRNGKEAALMEIAGVNRQFVPAKVEIHENTLWLSSEKISFPIYARYAWTDWSDKVNLFGENGLPLEPFVFDA